ncbi:hypothetical protein FQA47_010626 [Oryzias melastigma]|uniref:Uncharacterized protein n=1 Tax=Oryzias melastigma TaxID=30732 RepID=A0A834EY44_ORYME|nr:hypothetical protein FQA47_010626 [Oryzias melastigma]
MCGGYRVTFWHIGYLKLGRHTGAVRKQAAQTRACTHKHDNETRRRHALLTSQPAREQHRHIRTPNNTSHSSQR